MTIRQRWSFLTARSLVLGLIGASSVAILFYSAPSLDRSSVLTRIGTSDHASPLSNSLAQFGNWSAYNDAVDGLTSHECRTVFAGLYDEIDRAAAWWQDNGLTITKLDTIFAPERPGIMRFLIYDNEFRILLTQSVMTTNWRIHGFTSILERALASALVTGETLPVIEATLNTHDHPIPSPDDHKTLWTVTRKVGNDTHERLWLMPNYDFWWSQPTGSFEDARRLAMQYDHLSFAEKIPQVVWRGNPAMNRELRGPLLDVSKDKPWSDIVQVPAPNGDNDYKRLEHFQYCRYAMTIYTEGQTYSGRLTFLLNCRSLLIMPRIEWAMHYTHLLVPDGPDQNFVLVRQDWTDLEEKVVYYLDHPDEADRIIKNMLSVFRSKHTTRAATSCYMRELVKAYAKVSFEPETHMQLYDGEVDFPRGESWQAFVQKPWDDTDFELRTHVGD